LLSLFGKVYLDRYHLSWTFVLVVVEIDTAELEGGQAGIKQNALGI